MNSLFYIISAALFAGIIAVLYFIFDLRKKTEKPPEDKSMALLLQQMNELSRTVDQKMSDNTKQMGVQFSESSKLIKDVTEGLTKLGETNKQVISFADQLQNLQDILKNPKQRGVLGEYYLETTLRNVLPAGQFQMQYPFKDGTIVDAVVFVKNQIVPIDSKFSLENYNRLAEEKNPAERARLEKLFKADLKNRIDETSKYVKPAENTMGFAIMYIPHEAIYYELLISQVGAVKVNTRDLIDYAFKEKKVIIVSPTSFLAYLQTVLQGLNALKIEAQAELIRKNVENLQRHLNAYGEYHSKLGTTLGTAVNHYNNSTNEFKKVDKDMYKITGQSKEGDISLIESPEKNLKELI